MNLFKRIGVSILGLAVLGVFSMGKSVHAVSYYGLSCTNKAYGTQKTVHTIYYWLRWVAMDFTTSATGVASDVNSTGAGGTYVGKTVFTQVQV